MANFINKLKSILPLTGLFGSSKKLESFNETQVEETTEISTGGVVIIILFLVILFTIFMMSLVAIYNLSPPDTKIMHVGLTIVTSGFWTFIWLVYYGLFTDKFLQSPIGKRSLVRNNMNNRNYMNNMNTRKY